MSTTLLFAIGCIVFATTTLAALWVGYILFQRAWFNQNPELTSDADDVELFFTYNSHLEQRPRAVETVKVSSGPLER